MTITAADGTDIPQGYTLIATNERVSVEATGCDIECTPSRVLNEITIPVPECTLVTCETVASGLSAELAYVESGESTLEVIDENGDIVDFVSLSLSSDLNEF